MQIDLVQTTTRDGVRLDGGLWSSAGPPTVGLDAVAVVHGTGGNFYASTLFDELTARLRPLGVAVLRVNTRGHDGISTAVTAKGGRRLGAAYEVVDDCRHDVAAWVDWLRQQGYARVGLVGHSLGAVKCLYALAHDPLDVRGVVAISPPRLSYTWFCSSPEAADFLATYQEAERLAEAGKPTALLDVTKPLPFVITAAGYVEKYGPDERYNYLRFAAGVRVPTLFTFGSVEAANNMAFRAAAEAVAGLGRANLAVATIDGADHFYTGVRPALLDRIAAWLSSLAG